MVNFSICGSNGMNYLSVASDDMDVIDEVVHLLENRGAGVKKQFIPDDYIGKYAMHCPSSDKMRAFMRKFNIPSITFPFINVDLTDYLFDIGKLTSGEHVLISKSNAGLSGYTILEYDDFNWREDAVE